MHEGREPGWHKDARPSPFRGGCGSYVLDTPCLSLRGEQDRNTVPACINSKRCYLILINQAAASMQVRMFPADSYTRSLIGQAARRMPLFAATRLPLVHLLER